MRKAPLTLILASLLLLGAIWQWHRTVQRKEATASKTDAHPPFQPPSSTSPAASPSSKLTGTSNASLSVSIEELVKKISPRQAQANEELLAGLHKQLRSLPPSEAARLIVAFLDSGKDASTGLPFRVGKGGSLKTAPSLRVALLDWLGEISPDLAYQYADEIFSNSTSIDEWAVALRNYYRKTETADPVFINRVQEVFSRPAWVQNPSPALMESVDFAVAIGGNNGYTILKGLLTDSTALRLSGLMGLDAWTQSDRHNAIPQLAADAQTGDPLDERSRAALLSRADVRDEAQRRAVLAYLDSATVTTEAKTAFLRQFPNENMILGNRLVTQPQPSPLRDMAHSDAASLQFIDNIIQAQKYPALDKELSAARERLNRYVQSAKQAGLL